MSATAEQTEHPCEGKKLFIVQIEQAIMVLAEDEAEASEIATHEAGCGGNIEWNEADFHAYEGFLFGWDKSIPFGPHNHDMTCAQIRDAWREYEASRLPTQAELEALGQESLL